MLFLKQHVFEESDKRNHGDLHSLFFALIMTEQQQSSEESSTTPRQGQVLLSTHENCVFLQGNFGQTCMRVSDRYVLTGGLRWRKLDAAMQIATAFKEQGISCGYVGLTTNSLFHRFYEHDGAHTFS